MIIEEIKKIENKTRLEMEEIKDMTWKALEEFKIQPSSQFYYIIVINSTRFKISVSFVNVHRFIKIYIYIYKI